MRPLRTIIGIGAIAVGLGVTAPANGLSIRDEIGQVFLDLLNPNGNATASRGRFIPDDGTATAGIAASLTNLVAINAASFPLTSSSAVTTFDFSTGVPVPVLTSAGPIFSDRAETIGKKRFAIGTNLSFFSLSEIRGISTEDIEIAFQNNGDTENDGTFGNDSWEHDYIDVDLELDVSAIVFGVYGTYGVSDRLDVGFGIPLVSLSVTAQATGNIVSRSGNYSYDGGELVSQSQQIERSSFGVGDLAMRFKYAFNSWNGTDIALLGELRLPTGDEENFLGAGSASYGLALVASRVYGDWVPHVNLGYTVRASELDRDEVNINIGYDFQISPTVTLVSDWIGDFEVGGEADDIILPGVTEVDNAGSGFPTPTVFRGTNIPEQTGDNITSASFGMKWAPTQRSLFTFNLLLPTNDGGLRSPVVPTFGFEWTF